MRWIRLVAWLLAGWLAVSTAVADEPIVTRLTPDVRAYPQFFAVVQDQARQIYLGGTDGIARHDGGRWIWQPAPRRGPVRALLVDAGGRVWYGGSDSFGYLRTLPTGEQRYVDLAGQFAGDLRGRQFADVWTIAEHDGTIWFQALHDLFTVDRQGRRIGYWHRDERFGLATQVRGQLWVQWRGEGIRRWDGKAFVPVAGTAMYSGKPIYGIFELADGGLLVHDVGVGLSIWRAGAVTPIDAPTLRDAIGHLYWGVGLGNDRFAFGGDDGRLRVFDRSRQTFSELAVGNGFMSQIIRDRDGALLAVDDRGLIRIPWPLHWSRYGAIDGVAGNVHALARVDRRLFLCGTAGVAQAGVTDGAAVFPARMRAWLQGECWRVRADGDALLVAESMALLSVRGDAVTRLSQDDLYPRALLPDPDDPNLLWVGGENGPALFRRSAGTWHLQGRVQTPGWRITTLAAAPHGVWLGSDDHGLYRARADARAPSGFTLQAWATARGVATDDSDEAQVFAWPEGTYVSTGRGLFRLAGDRYVRDDLGGLQALLAEGEVVNLVDVDVAGAERWAYSYHTVFRKPAGGRWQVALVGDPMLGPIETLLVLPDGDVLVGAAGQVLRYRHEDQPSTAPESPPVRVTALRLTESGGRAQPVALDRPAHIASGGELAFDLGFSDYGSGEKQYQVRLQGLSAAWSDWSRQASYRYFSLPPGEYALQVRARTGYGEAIAGAPFRFVVEPRWYERRGVVPALIVVACALIAGALVQRQRLRVRRLRAHNRELDRLVHARTQDLEHANQRLQDLADRDGLTGIANRRRFDAFLTDALARARARGQALGLALVDVDHFKGYNDRHGHQAGDDVLRKVARLLADGVRGDTLVARYGGEEFAIVVPGCELAPLRELAERLRVRVRAGLGEVTISIGICEFAAAANESAEGLVARADAALYRAKNGGRDRVESWER
ncbi:MAG: GGDEF domain-containing protein [Proteobacteria bacterium]|nr:GGDEF domain-containing protein [Pseudomonadota bacterium]